MIVLWLAFAMAGLIQAQTNAEPANFGATNLSLTNAPSTELLTNAAPLAPTNAPSASTVPATPEATPVPATSAISPSAPQAAAPDKSTWKTLAAVAALLSLAGFLFYQTGLSQAKNCGHTSALLLLGATFGLIGYWTGGFAVQTGGVEDAHAALTEPIASAGPNGLDHELGFTAAGHHWGIMGSAGFFLSTGDASGNVSALLFLTQAALLLIALAAALGAALERARLAAMAVFSFLIGALIYPLFANWTWGGGWLAELGREYGLGHGFVDLAGAGVVHETAGTLALVIALVLGARAGRFGAGKKSIPGHNMPFVVLGAVLLLVSWTSSNLMTDGRAALAATNTLLAAAAGLLISSLLAGWMKRRPEPTFLCRGLLGGAVASCGCSALIDPWAAFVIGGFAGLFVQGASAFLARRRIDDPTGAAAIHGTGGAWGVLATGLFANGSAGLGINSVDGTVRGLFFGGAWYQLAAQAIGAVTGFVVVFILGYACLILVHKIMGIRVFAAEEAAGLDLSQTGALGYQADAEQDESAK